MEKELGQKEGKVEEPVTVTQSVVLRNVVDSRHKNWLLALRMLMNELVELKDDRVYNILKRWKVDGVGGVEDNYPLTCLEFPDDICRIQFFVNSKGEEYVRYIEAKKMEEIPK